MKFMHKRGRSLFSVASSLSRSAEKFKSFKKILVSKNFIHRTGGGDIIALSKIFCLAVRNLFVNESLFQ